MTFFKRRFRFRRQHGRGRGHKRRKRKGRHRIQPGNITTLADVPPGCKARVMGFTRYLPPERLNHFQALGLAPGHKVCVLQHSPVTVVQIEHTELALERELAREIYIGEIEE